MKEILIEVVATIDDDEDTKKKIKEIRRTIEEIDPSVAVFEVQNIQEV